MIRKRLEEPKRPFLGAKPVEEPLRHNGHIGAGPKPGPKRAVNLSVDAEILKVAKEMNLNLSKAFQDALRRLTEPERARRFYEKNKAHFDSYNAYIERNGIFGEELLDLDDPPV